MPQPSKADQWKVVEQKPLAGWDVVEQKPIAEPFSEGARLYGEGYIPGVRFVKTLGSLAAMPYQYVRQRYEQAQEGLRAPTLAGKLRGTLQPALELSPAGLPLGITKDALQAQAEQARLATEETAPAKIAFRSVAAGVPIAGPLAASVMETTEKEGTLPALEEAAGYAAAPKLIEKGGKLVPSAKRLLPSAVESRVQALSHERAMGVKAHVQAVADKVHDAAQALFKETAERVDAKSPNGAIDAQAVRSQVEASLGEYVKAKQTLPKSVQRILDVAEELPEVFGGKFDLTDPSQVRMMARMKEQGVIPPSAGRWTFEQAQQYRTQLGKELWGRAGKNLPGVVRIAMQEAYGSLSDALKNAAEQSGAGESWFKANRAWHQYSEDFLRSPLRKVLEAETAADVSGPLRGKTAERVNRIMSKYEREGLERKSVRREAKEIEKSAGALRSAFGPFSPWEYRLMLLGAPEIGRTFSYFNALRHSYGKPGFAYPKPTEPTYVPAPQPAVETPPSRLLPAFGTRPGAPSLPVMAASAPTPRITTPPPAERLRLPAARPTPEEIRAGQWNPPPTEAQATAAPMSYRTIMNRAGVRETVRPGAIRQTGAAPATAAAPETAPAPAEVPLAEQIFLLENELRNLNPEAMIRLRAAARGYSQSGWRDLLQREVALQRPKTAAEPAAAGPAAAAAEDYGFTLNQQKNPWEMTFEEWHEARRYNNYPEGWPRGGAVTLKGGTQITGHEAVVRKAIREGREVPAQVREEYPELFHSLQPATAAGGPSEVAAEGADVTKQYLAEVQADPTNKAKVYTWKKATDPLSKTEEAIINSVPEEGVPLSYKKWNVQEQQAINSLLRRNVLRLVQRGSERILEVNPEAHNRAYEGGVYKEIFGRKMSAPKKRPADAQRRQDMYEKGGFYGSKPRYRPHEE